MSIENLQLILKNVVRHREVSAIKHVRYREVSLYTKPVDEKLMSELIFNIVMKLISISRTPFEKKKRKKKSTANEEAGKWSREIHEMFSSG